MKKRLALSLILIVSILFIFVAVYEDPTNTIDHKHTSNMEKDYIHLPSSYTMTSLDIEETILELASDFPDILETEIIGQSVDGKNILAVRLSDGKAYTNTSHKHMLIEAGTHAREVANPNVALNLLENYIKDYYDDSVIEDLNIKDELQGTVLHWIILSNPDGYDLTKFGLTKVKTYTAMKSLVAINDCDHKTYKANLNGTDLNRNYPGEYYDIHTGRWTDRWGTSLLLEIPTAPASKSYPGPNPLSEPESIAVSDYALRYDFRVYLSMHSRGEQVYWEKPFLSKAFADHAMAYADIASDLTGYTREDSRLGDLNDSASGYLSEYLAFTTLKPAITLETTTADHPAKDEFYLDVYNRVQNLPVEFIRLAEETGYFDYKLYDANGVYIRDFQEEVYANALAEKCNGFVLTYEGKPYENLTLPSTSTELIAVIEATYN